MKSAILDFCDKEHDELKSLYDSYLDHKMDPSTERLKHFKRFKCGLHRHMSIEEDVIFAYYEEKTGLKESGPTFRMRQEHQEIRAVLQNIQTKIQADNPQTANDEMQIMSLFERHGMAENDVMFDIVELIEDDTESDQILDQMQNYVRGCCLKCLS